MTTPNPSVKLSTNGRPPGPSHRYGVHFLWLGPGVPPLAPALPRTLGSATAKKPNSPRSSCSRSRFPFSVGSLLALRAARLRPGLSLLGAPGTARGASGRSVRKTITNRWSSAKSLRCGGAFADGRRWNSPGSVAVRRPAAAASTNEVSVRQVFREGVFRPSPFLFSGLGVALFSHRPGSFMGRQFLQSVGGAA